LALDLQKENEWQKDTFEETGKESQQSTSFSLRN